MAIRYVPLKWLLKYNISQILMFTTFPKDSLISLGEIPISTKVIDSKLLQELYGY